MDAPPAHEPIAGFIRIARFLHRHGVHTPEIVDVDQQQGFIQLEDLGSTPLLSVLNDDTVTDYYQQAIDQIILMQLTPAEQAELPLYDEEKLRQELQLFPEWFLSKHLQRQPPEFLDSLFDLLIENATSQAQLFVHRDFHSRNLMVQQDKPLGVIDFQDAVIGPASYDLVSLLRDVYIQWPQAIVDDGVAYYYQQATQHGLLTTTSELAFQRQFDLMGVQRHLKILGIFCRLHYRDGKSNYLNDLGLTLSYLLAISAKYPELKVLHDYLDELKNAVIAA
jgi:aminoglycoside/choline kinase family phosphotransferase